MQMAYVSTMLVEQKSEIELLQDLNPVLIISRVLCTGDGCVCEPFHVPKQKNCCSLVYLGSARNSSIAVACTVILSRAAPLGFNSINAVCLKTRDQRMRLGV